MIVSWISDAQDLRDKVHALLEVAGARFPRQREQGAQELAYPDARFRFRRWPGVDECESENEDGVRCFWHRSHVLHGLAHTGMDGDCEVFW